MSPKTVERLQASLLEERARHVQQADELAAEAEQLAAEREGGDTQFDEESGEGDTINIERERDLLLSASAQQIVDEIDRALERIENKTYGLCLPAGPPHQPRAPRGAALRRDLRRLQGSCRATPLAAPIPRHRRGPRGDRCSRPRSCSASSLLDQLTKLWAVRDLADGPISVIGDDIGFALTRNTGSAFSLFQAFTPLLAIVAIGVAVLLVRAVRRTRDPLMVVGLSLVLGGALGNLVDRVFRAPGFLQGAVVDFVHVGSFPTFNVADSAITIGAVLIVIWAVRTDLIEQRVRAWSTPVAEEFAVPEALAGERVDRAVALLTGWTRSEVQALVEAGSVLVDGERVAKSRRLEADDVIELLAEPAAPGLPQPDPTVAGRRAVRGRRRRGRGQARGPRGAPRRRSPRRHARERPAGALPGARRRRRPGAPGHRPPARPRHQRPARGGAVGAGLRRAGGDARRPRRRTPLRRARCGARSASPRGVIDAPDRPLGAPPDAHGGAGGWSDRPHRVRGRRRVPRPGGVAARVPAGDRPDPSDPRAPAGDRPPGRGGRRLRRAAARCWCSTARSSTPAGLAFAHPVTGEPVRVEEELGPTSWSTS